MKQVLQNQAGSWAWQRSSTMLHHMIVFCGWSQGGQTGEEEGFDGVMRIQDQAGDLHVCAKAPSLAGPLEPGESHFPIGWRGDLAVGTYRLTWGAPNYRGVVVTFTIVERDGRLHLDQESMQTSRAEVIGNTDCGPAQSLVDQAKADLAKRTDDARDNTGK